MYRPRAPLGGGVDESPAGRSQDFSLVQTSASSSGKSEYLMRMTKASLVVDQWPPGLTKYVGLDLTLIRCRDLCRCMSGIMRCIRTVRMHQDDASDKASRPLGIEAEVEVDNSKIEVDVWRLKYAMA